MGDPGVKHGKTKRWECDEDIQPQVILGIWWELMRYLCFYCNSATKCWVKARQESDFYINFIPAFSCVFFRESCCNTHEHILPLSIQPSSSCNPCSCEEIEVLLAQAISGNLPPFVVLPTDYNPLLYNWDKTQIIDNRWSSVYFNFRHTTNNRFSHG